MIVTISASCWKRSMTSPNHTLKPIHDRMPVILYPDDYARWPDNSITKATDLADLLAPCPDDLPRERDWQTG